MVRLEGLFDKLTSIVLQWIAHSVAQKDRAALPVRKAGPHALAWLSNAMLARPLETFSVLMATNRALITTEVTRRLRFRGMSRQ